MVPDIELHERCRVPQAELWTMRGESFEKINDLYLWNAVWMMFVTSTTVGYGDLDATTNFGRVVASAMSVVGIVLVALLTAALSTALQWSEEELSSLLVMKREKAKQQLVHLAALTIQRRVRMRQTGTIGAWISGVREYVRVHVLGLTPVTMLNRLKALKADAKLDVDSYAADSQKTDHLFTRVKYLENALNGIYKKVRSDRWAQQGDLNFMLDKEMKAREVQQASQVLARWGKKVPRRFGAPRLAATGAAKPIEAGGGSVPHSGPRSAQRNEGLQRPPRMEPGPRPGDTSVPSGDTAEPLKRPWVDEENIERSESW